MRVRDTKKFPFVAIRSLMQSKTVNRKQVPIENAKTWEFTTYHRTKESAEAMSRSSYLHGYPWILVSGRVEDSSNH